MELLSSRFAAAKTLRFADPVGIIRLLALIIPLLVVAGVSFTIISSFERRLDEGGRTLASLNALLAEQFARLMESIHAVTRLTATRVLELGPGGDPREIELLRADMAAYASGLPVVRSIAWVRPDGQAISSSQSPGTTVFVGGMAQFPETMNLPAGTIRIMPPVSSPRDGSWSLNIIRPVIAAGGRRHGAVSVVIDPPVLAALYAPAALGPGFAGRLFQDFTLFATHPHDDKLIGQKFAPDSRVLDMLLDGSRHLQRRVISQIDQRERIVDTHQIGNLRLLSVLSVPVETIVADWRREATYLALGGSVCALVIGLGFWQLARVIRVSERAIAAGAEQDRLRSIAEAANCEKSRFLAAASHDLRQPLHALGLFASALARRVDKAEQVALVNNIEEASRSMAAMFGALLDLTRIDAGGIKPAPAQFPLAPLLEKLREEIEPVATAKGLSFRIAPTSAVIVTDPTLLETILRNLLSNAVRYTESGKVLAGCRRRADGTVEVQVLDTGAGIDEADRQRIFREFERAGHRPAGGVAEGMGLGLAIVRRLCDVLALTMGLRSHRGRGSMFWVRVPAARPIASAPANKVAGGQKKLLGVVAVVDDEPAIRAGLCSELSDREIECWAPEDIGRIDYARLGEATALVVDLNLGEADDGLAVLAEAERRLGRRLVAVLVTESTDLGTLARLAASGRRWLHKPVTGDGIVAELEKALEEAEKRAG
jgi:signal transduction histidine kinase